MKFSRTIYCTCRACVLALSSENISISRSSTLQRYYRTRGRDVQSLGQGSLRGIFSVDMPTDTHTVTIFPGKPGNNKCSKNTFSSEFSLSKCVEHDAVVSTPPYPFGHVQHKPSGPVYTGWRGKNLLLLEKGIPNLPYPKLWPSFMFSSASPDSDSCLEVCALRACRLSIYPLLLSTWLPLMES